MLEVKRICPGCGKPFTMAQSDFDQRLKGRISTPIYCSSRCSFQGWDPVAVRYCSYRRAMDTQNS